jgi:hypothetical protein|tara:strand:- start:214 stop:513 length:300 start_codon:yes stop_codon:yes gene_type:complete
MADKSKMDTARAEQYAKSIKNKKRKAKNVHSSAKSVQGSPHNRLMTSQEIDKIVTSAKYKDADYKGKTEMLGGKVYNFNNGGKVRIAKKGGGRAYGRNS